MVDKLIKKYMRGWEVNEHITTFACQLNKEQEKLLHNDIAILDVDKNQYYMLVEI